MNTEKETLSTEEEIRFKDIEVKIKLPEKLCECIGEICASLGISFDEWIQEEIEIAFVNIVNQGDLSLATKINNHLDYLIRESYPHWSFISD